ncbi:MAG TPA: tyrosine-type recombinase/integrase, partial [Candidatus Angelobacter sp.]|nr:tyrosine-type recombinase/integrase [Candidatus Angelobacter sp.]
YSRKAVDRFIKKYAEEAGLREDSRHHHVLKHSAAMLIWSKSHSIGEVQNWLGHKSTSSSLVYLNEIDSMKAFSSLSAAL